MATLDVIQRAHAAGMNFIVTHEPTFWSDTDAVKGLEDDPVFRFKVEFSNKNNIAVWRFHDLPARAQAGCDVDRSGAGARLAEPRERRQPAHLHPATAHHPRSASFRREEASE